MTPYLEIHEAPNGECVRLRLTGELDLFSAPLVKRRLAQLRAENRAVRLDLSDLGFMDSSGIHLLISAFDGLGEDGWQLEIDPDLSRPVERLFSLAGLDRVLSGHGMSGR